MPPPALLEEQTRAHVGAACQILGSSMSFIDGSVVNVALPVMQRSLATTFGTLQWVVNGYMLTFARIAGSHLRTVL